MSSQTALRVLLVDDSRSMRLQLRQALERLCPVEPAEAADGAEAWRQLSGGTFDLVLTDINMPVMDGLKLIALIRREGSNREVPLVVISTEGADDDRQRAMALGANAYLVKPVKAHQVVAAVKELLRL
jgi:two-component system, chemotaxis family, chemotaxis protein CheY